MKTNTNHRHPTITKEAIWIWYGVVLLIASVFAVLLYNLPTYQPLFILLLSLWVIVDALLIYFLNTGKTKRDSIIGTIVFFCVGIAGLVVSLLVKNNLFSLIPRIYLSAIAFIPCVLTNQILNSLLMNHSD